MIKESEKPVVLVTGGSRGIGRAISLRFAAEGYHVIVNYKSNQEEAEKTLEMIVKTSASGKIWQFILKLFGRKTILQ